MQTLILRTKGMQIPLFDELFSDAAVQLHDTEVSVARRDDRDKVIFTVSVQWTDRGVGGNAHIFLRWVLLSKMLLLSLQEACAEHAA